MDVNEALILGICIGIVVGVIGTLWSVVAADARLEREQLRRGRLT